MSAQLQPGDVVVCIRVGCDVYPGASSYVLGAFYRVTEACFFTDGNTGVSDYCVRTDRHNPQIGAIVGWARATRFRKIDAADEQFTADMRACKPSRHSRELVK